MGTKTIKTIVLELKMKNGVLKVVLDVTMSKIIQYILMYSEKAGCIEGCTRHQR